MISTDNKVLPITVSERWLDLGLGQDLLCTSTASSTWSITNWFIIKYYPYHGVEMLVRLRVRTSSVVCKYSIVNIVYYMI